MPPRKTPEKRIYQPHGHYALHEALKDYSNQEAWLEGMGEMGKALKAWQAAVIYDLGGEDNISAMQRSVIELATKTHLMLSSIDQWMLEQPSLINRSKRQLFPIVLQRQQIADALARYMNTLGLEKKSKTVTTIGEYIEEKAS